MVGPCPCCPPAEWRRTINRIDQKFSALTAAHAKGLLPYITAGFPSLAATAEVLRRVDALGVAGVEVGFPYSDSIADGPVIQTSFTRALERNLKVDEVFRTIAEVRRTVTMPLVAMVSFSIVTRIGVDRFFERASAAGFDGLIMADLSLEEAPRVAEQAAARHLRLIMLTAPTSSAERRERIARIATGFIYYMSVAGTTGERDRLPDDLIDNVRQLREIGRKPVVVGFGISRPEHVRSVCSVADGVIVGSAIVRRMLDVVDAGGDECAVADAVEACVRDLLTGLP
ncbi:MAG: tryptophan synthase subunit alpha [Phycisphaerae bacterium]|nr:tryptophan synthase subunit alpha [Phycisphaerae bacterium]